ncbi:apoptosis inhibitor 5 homolog [Teleopsis dalmanni]|uniref:apoptosis inhibitor 5 homolog n=1 Tax=Teleopsis dalmanni TaxID=139649 RepID=UPI0018CEDB6C|nr:apoptosis inhibitor 5 homolog [Teleopsis dalmanni]
MDKIEHLYKCYDVLSEAGEDKAKHAEEYKTILNAVKGSSKEKRLASQFIGKFFKYFPDLTDNAIDAQLDLCEDDDIQIRKQAIKDLPKLCLDNPQQTPRIADTLAQLLVLTDVVELQQVFSAFETIIKKDTKGSLAGLFQQISNGDEVTRERCFKYILKKLLPMGPAIITSEVEEYIVDEIKKILMDVSADDFHFCMNILGSTKLGSTITGHSQLVNLAKEQAELNNDIDEITIDDEIVERFIQCSTHAMPYFSHTIKSTEFVEYVCDKLLPLATWNMLATAVQQNQVQLRLLKVFAEMTPYCDVLPEAVKRIDSVYTVLREYMPLPQLDDKDVGNTTPSFEFSHAECLLYALHTLGKKNTNSFSFINDPEKLKDFRSRLQYLARGTQGYIKKLEEAVKGKNEEELKSEENQVKLTALKTTSNISVLIRDLFHSPPIFKHDVLLSWVTPKNNKLLNKRHAPITFDKDRQRDVEKKSKVGNDQKIYAPPSGKYSANVQTYGTSNNRSRQRNPNGRNGSGAGGRIDRNNSRNGGGNTYRRNFQSKRV